MLVMRLDNSSDTERWLDALEAATQRSRSYREMLRDVPLLSSLDILDLGSIDVPNSHWLIDRGV